MASFAARASALAFAAAIQISSAASAFALAAARDAALCAAAACPSAITSRASSSPLSLAADFNSADATLDLDTAIGLFSGLDRISPSLTSNSWEDSNMDDIQDNEISLKPQFRPSDPKTGQRSTIGEIGCQSRVSFHIVEARPVRCATTPKLPRRATSDIPIRVLTHFRCREIGF